MLELDDQAVRFEKKLEIVKNRSGQVVQVKVATIISADDLAMFDPQLKGALFWRNPDRPPALFETDDPLEPRVACLKEAIKLTAEGVGYELVIECGLEQITTTCDWGKVTIEPVEQGAAVLRMTLAMDALPALYLTRLTRLLDTGEVRMTLKAPEPAQQQMAA